MTVLASDDVTLQEVARTLSDMRQEFRTQLSTLVRTDVYRAEQAATELRLKRIEEERGRDESEKDSFRRLLYGAFLSSAGALVAALIMFLISRH